MEEIEVGEYVRTKYDGILKIRDIKEEEVFNTYYAMGRSYSYSEKRKFIYYRDDDRRISIDDIVKHSQNLIDLIEVGDYVNGEMVDTVFRDGIIYYDKLRIHTTEYNDYFEEDIKSIVTKEQFANMEYKIQN